MREPSNARRDVQGRTRASARSKASSFHVKRREHRPCCRAGSTALRIASGANAANGRSLRRQSDTRHVAWHARVPTPRSIHVRHRPRPAITSNRRLHPRRSLDSRRPTSRGQTPPRGDADRDRLLPNLHGSLSVRHHCSARHSHHRTRHAVVRDRHLDRRSQGATSRTSEYLGVTLRPAQPHARAPYDERSPSGCCSSEAHRYYSRPRQARIDQRAELVELLNVHHDGVSGDIARRAFARR